MKDKHCQSQINYKFRGGHRVSLVTTTVKNRYTKLNCTESFLFFKKDANPHYSLVPSYFFFGIDMKK